MKKTALLLLVLISCAAAHADRGTSPQIFTSSAQAATRARACEQAQRLAELSATDLPALQLQGRVEKLEKKCDCGEEEKQNFSTKKVDKFWSCLGTVSFTYKK